MVVILTGELGVDETTARRVLSFARTIAPIDTVTDEDARDNLVAVLAGVAQEASARGPRNISAQSVRGASVNYTPASSWFTPDDRASIRALCGLPAADDSSAPVGSFPAPSGPVSALWPERYS